MSEKFRLLSDESDDIVVWGAAESVTLTGEELAAISGDAFIVKGDLTVEGRFSVDDPEQYKIDGDVNCDSFWIGEGLIECETINVKTVTEFAVDYACLMESLEDVGEIKTQIVYCPWCPADEIPTSLTFEFAIEEDVEDEDKLSTMLSAQYNTVLTALKNGETIDDAWLAKN